MPTFRVQNKPVEEYENYKMPIKFDITMLNMFIGYVFKKNSSNITRRSLSIMNKMFNIIDTSVYDGEPQLYSRVEFIKNALDARLIKGFENFDIILNYCMTEIHNSYNDEIAKNIPIYTKINYEEIKFVNKCVEDRLKYYYILKYKEKIYNTVEKLDSGDYRSYEDINNELFNLCINFTTDARNAKTFNTEDVFSFSDENFEDNVIDIVANLKNPKKLLRTGIQKLNELLSPAFMAGRTYIFMGTPGGFKSGLLLKITRDIKKYNKGIVGSKPGKTPCVLLLTMENSVAETVERLFNMTATSNDIRNYTPKQVVKILKDTGEFKVTEEDNIDIVIRYEANRTISTTDVYTIIEDLSDSGSEVIAFVLDYIKRIRPAEKGKDEKEELKFITNELKSLAETLSIPVISAHQLNRDAASTVDAAMQANKSDLGRLIGRANVGSAWEVMENSDFVCIIYVEKKRSTGQYYLTFNRVKIRYKAEVDLGYFNHPFDPNNKMKLLDDVGLPQSLSEVSLSSDFDGVDMTNSKGTRHAKEREDVTSFSIFDFNSSLNKKK